MRASLVAPALAVSLALAAPIRAGAQNPEKYTACKTAGAKWGCCTPGEHPCTRPRPARLVLFTVGLLAGAGASALLFALGDRRASGDPGTLLVGLGATAAVGAIAGAVAGRFGADGRGDPDRIRPATVGLDWSFGRPGNLDETAPHTLSLRYAPTYFFPGGWGRVRLIGHLGGRLGTARDVDPRPQNAVAISGQEGTAPVVGRRRLFTTSVGVDLAVSLPYPVLSPRRSTYLGASEVRYKPEVQIRRHVHDATTDTERVVERTMLLPLTVGMRWRLAPRQRFTVYVGPRFDFVSFSEPGSRKLERGPAQIGPLYGEAWYDVDIPYTLQPRRDGVPRKAHVVSQLSMGYVHSRFDGNGLNFGPVIGFLGPVHVAYHTRVRPRGWPVALQNSVGVAIGSAWAVTINFGVVLPDLGDRPK